MKRHLKFTIFALLLTALQTVVAQQGNTQVNVASSGKTIVGVEEISAFEFLIKGGIFLIPIAVLLFYTIYLGVEKYLYIRKRVKHDKKLLIDIETSLNSGNLENALVIVSRDKTAFGNVVKEGIQTIGRPVTEIENHMEKVSNIEVGMMEKNLGHLGLIAGIAPTLGFIGTISGVIKIFYSISITENVSIGNISGGLYEKMISSGAGLVAGIIAFSFYHLLNGMIDTFVLRAQKINLDFINLIQRPNGHKTK